MRQTKVFKHEFDTCFTILSPLHFGCLGIYQITTIGKIKDGKHMNRVLESYFSLYLAPIQIIHVKICR